MNCATCGGKGWIADGSSHGVACVDCMPDVGKTYERKTHRPAPQFDGVKAKPSPSFATFRNGQYVRGRGANPTSLPTFKPCSEEGCVKSAQRGGMCKRHWRNLLARKSAAKRKAAS